MPPLLSTHDLAVESKTIITSTVAPNEDGTKQNKKKTAVQNLRKPFLLCIIILLIDILHPIIRTLNKL